MLALKRTRSDMPLRIYAFAQISGFLPAQSCTGNPMGSKMQCRVQGFGFREVVGAGLSFLGFDVDLRHEPNGDEAYACRWSRKAELYCGMQAKEKVG